MELFVELNKLDAYDWWFYASLFLALVSVFGSMVLSYFSAKYWKLDRSRAVLKNAGNMGSNLDRNLCKSVGDIDLTNDFYRVEFGIPAQPVDAITLRAVIEGEDWKDGMTTNVQAQISLRDGSFVINGAKGEGSKDAKEKAGSRFFDFFRFGAEGKVSKGTEGEGSKDAEGKVSKGAVSIYSYDGRNQNDISGGILYYDEQNSRNIKGDSVLKDKDLIYIKDKNDKKIAAFVFLKVIDDSYDKDEKIKAVQNIVVRNQKI